MKIRYVFQSLFILFTAQLVQGQELSISLGSADGYIRKISDNGKWGLVEKSGTVEGSIVPGGGYVINLETLRTTDISHVSGLSGVSDITDDGRIIVGEAQTLPAYYSVADRSWHIINEPEGIIAGRLESVTPDGKYAAGYYTTRKTSDDQVFDSYSPLMYDITNGTVVSLPGMPLLDMQHENHNMTMISDISANGRYLVGRVSQSYVAPPGLFSFVYDCQTNKYTPIGFTENRVRPWSPNVPNTLFCDFPYISPNGEWVVGTAYMVEEIAGSEWGNEYTTVYRYHIPSGEYVCYNNGVIEQNIDGVSVLDDGTVTAATPSGNPYADALVRSGKYFVSLNQVLLQNYGTSFFDKTGWDNTGKLIAVSGDGKTLVSLVGPTTSYIIRLPESLSEAASKVDLMADYTVTPAPNSVMSKLKTFKVRFDRNITVLKAAEKITFTGSDGNSYNALTAEVTEDATTTLSITFRTRTLADGVTYTLNIPDGMVALKGDNSMTSKAMSFKYTGHADTPMRLTSTYPADGAEVPYIDAQNNPVQLAFDVELAAGDGAAAYLYRDDEVEPYAVMNISIGENKMILYPSARINLFKGSDYRLVIAANTVTDITGGCANKEITINWVGSYVREWSTDDKYLFNETCDNFENFMFYEGDCLTPAPEPASWGFTQYTTPWYVTRDSETSSDMAFTAHSMYSPSGKADDWCVIPQIFIPDANCYLTFDAQSYLNSKTDYLKVYIYEQENVYSILNTNIVDAIRNTGDLVFNKQLSPGATEGNLEGEWTNYVVKLNDYVGKPIYIAFVNDNENQSAIFLDNIQVIHDMHYMVTMENKNRVVNADDIAIRGNISVASDVDNYKKVSLKLYDANNHVVSTITDNNVDLSKGDVYNFEFPDKLQLAKGESNKYYIDITLGDVNTIVNGEIKNLMFEPYRRVVIEEYSGQDCGNCPQGFQAMDNIEKKYPGRVIPVILRTYNNDPLGNSVTLYSNYLGMESVGAPSGRVNRGSILSPMLQANGVYSLTGAPYGDVLWYDQFVSEIAEPAEAEINFTSKYDAATSTATVNTTVRNALSGSNTGINIFAVVVEDNVDGGFQSNYFANVDSEALGDWGKGGKYATAYVYPFFINDVARATWGNTYQGTGGLIPSTVEGGKEYKNTLDIKLPSVISNPANCKVVVMLIDALRGNVINANVAPMVDGESIGSPAGVEEVVIPDEANISIVAREGMVIAAGAQRVAAYSADGRMLGIASSLDGECSVLNLEGYTGLAIVVAIDAHGNGKSAKLVITH